MKKYLTLLHIACLSIGVCASCQKEETQLQTPQQKIFYVRFSMSEMDQFTRAISEGELQDVNLYFYTDWASNAVAAKQIYVTNPNVVVPVPVSVYDTQCRVVAVANIHRDLGNLTAADLESITTAPPAEGTLPMSAYTEIDLRDIRPGEATQQTFPLRLERAIAKINYNISLAPAAGEIQITSVEFCSIPTTTKCIGGNVTPSTSAASYQDHEVFRAEAGTQEPITGTFYMADNPQGEVPSITDQKLKNKSNAPAHASHIIIHARKGAKVLMYYIYLGANNTSDFNVRRNQEHTMNIRILNDSEVDTRITAYTLRLYDGWTQEYNTVEEVELHTEITAQNLHGQTLVFEGELEVLEGAAGFELDRVEDTRFLLGTYISDGAYWYINYNPSWTVFTTANNTLRYKVALSNNDGISYEALFEHKFANYIAATAPQAAGRLAVTGAIEANNSGTASVGAVCMEGGCTFSATPNPGYLFDGWYSDSAFTQLLSMDGTYTHRPRTANDMLYTKWKLSTSYTVDINCRESNKNSTYMFNANSVSLTSHDYTGTLKVNVTGVTGGVMETAVNYTIPISAGQTIPVGVLNFVPTQVGVVEYTINVTTTEGILIASKTITNTAVATTLVPTIQIEYGGEYFIAGYELSGERADWGGYNDISIRVAFSPVLDHPLSLGSRELLHVKFTPQISTREVYRTWVTDPDDPYGPERIEPNWQYLPTPDGCEFNEVDVTYAADIAASSYYLLKGINELPGNNETSTPTVFQPHTFGQNFLQIPRYDSDANSMYGRLMVTYTLKPSAQPYEIVLTNKLIGIPLNIETDVRRMTYINRLN